MEVRRCIEQDSPIPLSIITQIIIRSSVAFNVISESIKQSVSCFGVVTRHWGTRFGEERSGGRIAHIDLLVSSYNLARCLNKVFLGTPIENSGTVQ